MAHERVSARLAELGIELPAVPTPAGAYLPALRSGNLVFSSGQLPMVDGAVPATGKVGAEVTPEQGYQLARTCAVNALAAVGGVVDLDSVGRVVTVVGFVARDPSLGGKSCG